jgi:hypothetical protein
LSLRRGFFRDLAHCLALALCHDLNPFLACPGRSDPGFLCRPGRPRRFAALQHEKLLRATPGRLQAFFCTAQKFLMADPGRRARAFRVATQAHLLNL